MWTIALITYIISLLLHTFGIFLLITKRCFIGRSQKVFMINLSISEILLSLSAIGRTVMYAEFGTSNLFYEISVVLNLSACLPYYTIMYALTIDRFAEIYLHMHYPLYWSARRTRYISILLWTMTGFVMVLLFMVVHVTLKHTAAKLQTFAYKYVFPCSDLVFAILAFITYTYVITKLKSNKKFRHIQKMMLTSVNSNEKIKKKKRNNHLLLPTLLIITFILFIEIPDLIAFLSHINVLNRTANLNIALNVLYSIGYSSDAVIYVLLSTSFKKQMLKLLGWID